MSDLIIKLPQDEWMKILNILAEHPFKISAPLINQIQQQSMAQMQRMPSNGSDPNVAGMIKEEVAGAH